MGMMPPIDYPTAARDCPAVRGLFRHEHASDAVGTSTQWIVFLHDQRTQPIITDLLNQWWDKLPKNEKSRHISQSVLWYQQQLIQLVEASIKLLDE